MIEIIQVIKPIQTFLSKIMFEIRQCWKASTFNLALVAFSVSLFGDGYNTDSFKLILNNVLIRGNAIIDRDTALNCALLIENNIFRKI